MQTIKNDKLKIVILAWQRCGTGHLESIARHSLNWNISHQSLERIFLDQKEYKLYGAVRHPYDRFLSFFSGFVLSTQKSNLHYISNPYNWSKQDAELFFNRFANTMHYDPHTAFQQYLFRNLNSPVEFNYIDHKDIDVICGGESYKHKTNPIWKQFSKSMDKEIIDYITTKSKELYASDIEWYKKLNLL